MDNKKRIAVNSIYIFIRICIISVVSLMVSRIVLDALGASDFGLYSVVGGIVSFLNVANGAMISTTYRYLAFEVGKKDNGNPNKIFNVSFQIHVCFAIGILVIGSILGLWYINNYLNVDPEKLSDARFVFIISLLTTAFNTLFIPNQGLLVAYEKFSVKVITDVVSQLGKLAMIYFFIFEANNRLRLYAIIMMIYTLAMGGAYFIYCVKKFWTVVKPRIYRDWELCKEMLSYAIWTLFGALSNMGKNQGSAILLNFFFGTVINAAFAVANQVESFIGMFSGSLGQAAVPQITKNFSGGEKGSSLKLACYISKYTYLLMLLVAFPILLETDFLLGLWLKEIPEGTVEFCRLIILGGLLACLGAGIPALVNATGQIRNYQIITHCFILLIIPISFILFKLGFNPYTISIVYCVIIFLSAFLKLYLLNRIFKFDVFNFIKIAYIKIFYVSLPLLGIFCVYDSSSFSTIGHTVSLILSEMVLMVVILLLGTDKTEIKLISNMIKRKIN